MRHARYIRARTRDPVDAAALVAIPKDTQLRAGKGETLISGYGAVLCVQGDDIGRIAFVEGLAIPALHDAVVVDGARRQVISLLLKTPVPETDEPERTGTWA